jgi:hypothetical protein
VISGSAVNRSSRIGTASGSLSMIFTFETEARRFRLWNVLLMTR